MVSGFFKFWGGILKVCLYLIAGFALMATCMSVLADVDTDNSLTASADQLSPGISGNVPESFPLGTKFNSEGFTRTNRSGTIPGSIVYEKKRDHFLNLVEVETDDNNTVKVVSYAREGTVDSQQDPAYDAIIDGYFDLVETLEKRYGSFDKTLAPEFKRGEFGKFNFGTHSKNTTEAPIKVTSDYAITVIFNLSEVDFNEWINFFDATPRKVFLSVSYTTPDNPSIDKIRKLASSERFDDL